MSIRRSPRGRDLALTSIPERTSATVAAALEAGDIERAALYLERAVLRLLIDVSVAARQGDIDDLVALLGGELPDDDATRS